MDRFVSHFTLRLDAKGRVSIPASFRSVLARDGFEGLYCYPTLDRPALDAGGNALLEEIERLITQYSPYSEEREQFSTALFGTSEVLKIDGEGRVVLTESLKQHAAIADEATFAGLGHKFQIWEPGRFRAELAEATEKIRALKRQLGSRVAAQTPHGARDCVVIGIDRDRNAVVAGEDLVRAASGRLVLLQRNFSELQVAARNAGHAAVDGVVFDLGVSSAQLDDPARGFSFRHDGFLDMRMGSDGPTAADLIRVVGERDLARIIATLGEERHARALARAIVRRRSAAPIRTTRALAEIICRIVHGRPGAIHPATRTFQALRIFVNDELAELLAGLGAAEQILKPGGRLVVVAFHSLEDRIVKSFLAERATEPKQSRHLPPAHVVSPAFTLLIKRPLLPDAAEVTANPRARSAKLRAAERTGAPPWPRPAGLLPRLPSLAEVMERAQ